VDRPADAPTRVTLLERLCRSGAADQGAWSEFVEHYGPQIYQWCLRWRLQEADAEDVTQKVLLNLARHMHNFTYDPGRSFRAWLKTVTHHAWQDFIANRERSDRGSGDSAVMAWLANVECREDLTQRLEESYDRELLDKAALRVRLRVRPHIWEAFRLTALENVAPAEVGRRLSMKVAAVYVARSRVQKMLKDELQQLEQGE
jgi:RNA polymerase sigma-70 factor (ECF subfamily)